MVYFNSSWTLHGYPHLRLANFGVKWDREGQEENEDDDEEVNWREDLLKFERRMIFS